MAGEWLQTTLGSLTEWTSGGTPDKEEPSYWNGDIPWISAVSMKTTRLEESELKITSSGLTNGSRLADLHSVLLLVRGSELHKRIPIGIAMRPLAFNQDIKALKARESLLPEFLLYWLLANEKMLLTKVEYTGIGAGKLDTNVIKNLPILLPGRPTQRAIAYIFGTLDDKIELNRRMNETLEMMAQALFKSWFVDFDPVRAKADGRDPGLPKHIADMFPDSFEDTELGEIPKGWEVVAMDEIAHFLNGLALQKYPPQDGPSLPVIKIAQLRSGSTERADLASADLEPDYIVEDGDVLFSWSGSLECVLWAGGRGALNQHLFKVTSDKYPKWLCYLGVHQHLADFRHIAAGKATTMGHIQRHHLSDAKLVIPPRPLLQAMEAVIAPVIESIWRRQVQSRTLAALRDTLLPKLISGELRVKDAEHFMAEAI